MVDDDLVRAHRARALSPDRPSCAHGPEPDVYFQARETVNRSMKKCPASSRKPWTNSPAWSGGSITCSITSAPDADRVIVIMGSGAETVQETIEHLNVKGEKLA